MAKNCVICNKKIGFMDEVYEFPALRPNAVLCHDCNLNIREMKYTHNREHFVAADKYFTSIPDIPDEVTLILDSLRNEVEERISVAEKKDYEKNKYKRVTVTTCDLHEDYEIIGPVYFQTSNKGIFSSALSGLIEQYQKDISSMKELNLMSEERADWGFLIGAGYAGQNEFEKAFYVSVQELRKRCAALGGDAIIGLRQDIDMDTTGFQFFYLQMYGTAVKKKTQPSD